MENTNNSNYSSALEKFFVTSLQEIYWGENHLISVLNTMAESATADELETAFNKHKQQTEGHVSKLEKVFSIMNREVEPLLSIGLQGLFDEGWQVIDETESGTAQRDVALIIAAQKVEHYEIATYGSLVTLAKTLHKDEAASLLFEILQEEKETDELLTGIAEARTNQRAGEEPVEEAESPGKSV